MARMTKKLIKNIWEITNECYRLSLIEEYSGIIDIENISALAEMDLKIAIADTGKPVRSKSINDKYLYRLKQLDSKTISLIIEAHQKEKIKRSPITIHALMDELFERASNSESSNVT